MTAFNRLLILLAASSSLLGATQASDFRHYRFNNAMVVAASCSGVEGRNNHGHDHYVLGSIVVRDGEQTRTLQVFGGRLTDEQANVTVKSNCLKLKKLAGTKTSISVWFMDDLVSEEEGDYVLDIAAVGKQLISFDADLLSGI